MVRNYDVFISHRGPDTKGSFADSLHQMLKHHLLECFLDRPDIGKGESISEEIRSVLHCAKVYVIVFSPNFADSKWCLDEVFLAAEAAKEKDSTKKIFPVFYGGVRPHDVRHPDKGCYAKSFAEAKHISKEKLGQYMEAFKFVADKSGYEMDMNRLQSETTQQIIADVLQHLAFAREMQAQDTRLAIAQHHQVEEILSHLRVGSDSQVISVGITGQGGIGKTTLAKQVYNEIFPKFEARCFLENVQEWFARDGVDSLERSMIRHILKVDRLPDQAVPGAFLRERVKGTTLLLVLDSVESEEVLDKLMPWELGAGSRIIVTSRDTGVLKKLNSRYEVKEMNTADARRLFESKALPEPGIEASLVSEAVDACKGIPLALQIIGSLLKDKEEEMWRAYILKIRTAKELIDKLKISLEPLDQNEKEVFLDVCCFLYGTNLDTAVRVWESCNIPTAKADIQLLVEKHLLSVQDGTLKMHDTIRDMGRQVANEDATDKWLRKRIWDSTDAEDVLDLEQEMPHIRSFVLAGSVETWQISSFNKTLSRLKFLDVSNCSGLENGDFCSRLTCLKWHGMSFEGFPTLHMGKMVFMNLTGSEIKSLWQPQQVLRHMAEVILDECTYLETVTEEHLSRMPKLQRIGLRNCSSLARLPAALGALQYLVQLDISGCCRVQEMPEIMTGSIIKRLSMNGCSSIRSLPQSIGNLTKLEEFDLSSTAITELPTTFGRLQALHTLNMSYCEHLASLDSTFGQLRSLKSLDMSHTGVSGLPEGFGQLSSLAYLNLKACGNLEELSPCFGNLKNLEKLVLKESPKFSRLPQGFGKLSKLTGMDLGGCNLVELPEDIKELKSLGTLEMMYNKFGFLPLSISYLSGLQELQVHHCFLLREVVTQGQWFHHGILKKLDMGDCSILTSLPSLDGLNELEELILCNCSNLEEIKGLKGLQKLNSLNISGCSKLAKVHGLEEARSLQSLYLSGSKVIFSDFKSLPKLEIVSFYSSLLPQDRKNLLKAPLERRKDCRELCMEQVVEKSDVHEVAFMLVSHDQGWSDYEWNHGRYRGSSFLEVSIFREKQELHRATIVHNRHADRRQQLHICLFRKGGGFVEMLKAGDTIGVWAVSYYLGWEITVKQASMEILYEGAEFQLAIAPLHTELRWQNWRAMTWDMLPCWLKLRELAALDLVNCSFEFQVEEQTKVHRQWFGEMHHVTGTKCKASHTQLLTQNRWSAVSKEGPAFDFNRGLGSRRALVWLDLRKLEALDLEGCSLLAGVASRRGSTGELDEICLFYDLLRVGSFLKWLPDVSCLKTTKREAVSWRPCVGCRRDERPFFRMRFGVRPSQLLLSSSSTAAPPLHLLHAATSKDDRIQLIYD